jgi:hypothetical protein
MIASSCPLPTPIGNSICDTVDLEDSESDNGNDSGEDEAEG